MQIRSFRFGDWLVDRSGCTLAHDGEAGRIQIEPRAMDVLTALCTHSGNILSADDLLQLCWDGLNVGENQVHKAIAQLRRAFGDSANEPRYIENIRKRGYRTIAPVILEDDPAATLAGRWSHGSPYVGLDPFDAAHAELFFGREAAIAKLSATVAAQVATDRALVLVLGPSGSGKTSLVQAGLLPALCNANQPFTAIATTMLDLGDIGAVPPLSALGGALLDLEVDGQPVLAEQSAEGIGAGLAAGTDLLITALRDRAWPNGKFVLFIDGLEALFDASAIDVGQRARLLSALDRLARGGSVIVVAACRNDFYPNIAKEAVLMEGKAAGAHFDLGPPSRAEIAQMIRLPALAAGLSFGIDPETKETLDDLLCDAAAHSPDALPLLQYTLQELYFQRSNSRELTVAAYRALGGIDGAIGKRAEAAVSRLPAQSQASLFRILPLIVSIGADDGLLHSHRAPWSALGEGEDRILVRALVDQRLFVSHVQEGQSVFGVAHEALLRQWPRVVDWIAEHRQALRTRSRLEAAAAQWMAEKRRPDLLLPRGKQLEEARELAERPHFQMSPAVRALIAASVRRMRQGDYLRLAALAGFGALTVTAVTLGLRANHAEGIANQRRLEADDLMNYMVGDFTDKLRPLGRLDLLDGAAQKALRYLTGEDFASLPGEARLQQAKALLTLAEVGRARGNPSAALQALDQADRLLQANLAQGPVDAELLKTLGAVSFWRGQIALDQGRIDEAEGQFTHYRDYAQRMNAIDPDNVDAWIELSYALSSLGSLFDSAGAEEKAARNFEATIALKRRALQQRPHDLTLQRDLSNSLSWLANTKVALGALPAALDLYDQQRVLLEERLDAEPSALVWSYYLALSNEMIGATLEAQGKTDEALSKYKISLKLLDKIVLIESENQSWNKERIWIELRIFRITLLNNNGRKLQYNIDQVVDEVDRMVKKNSDSEGLNRIIAFLYYLRSLESFLENKPQDAEEYIEKSESTLNALRTKNEKHSSRIVALSNVLNLKAKIYRQLDDSKRAKEACKASIDNLADLAQDSQDYRVLDPWIRANICYGNRSNVIDKIAYLDNIGYHDHEYVRYITDNGR